MSEWLRLRDIAETSPVGTGLPDLMVNIVMSPYDVPEAVRGIWIAKDRLRIDFRYIDGDEPGRVVGRGSHTIAIEGRYSGRLLGLEIDMGAIGADTCGVAISAPAANSRFKQRINSAWNDVNGDGSSVEAQRRWNMTRRAFETREADLLSRISQ